MKGIADQVAALEDELDSLKSERDMLQRQVNRQEGAIREGRDEREILRRELRRWQSKVDGYESYFRNLHHGLNDLEAKRASTAAKINKLAGEKLTEPSVPQPRAQGAVQLRTPAPIASLTDRLRKVRTQ